jgi:hypothetical protein
MSSHIFWGTCVGGNAHVGEGTGEPVDGWALHDGRLDIENVCTVKPRYKDYVI